VSAFARSRPGPEDSRISEAWRYKRFSGLTVCGEGELVNLSAPRSVAQDPAYSVTPQSEDQLQSELQLPRAAQIAARRACRRDLTEGGRGERVLWLREIRMIQNIECLRAELQRHAFANRRVLGDREVHILEPRRRENVA